MVYSATGSYLQTHYITLTVFYSATGSYLYLLETKLRPEYNARVTTPFMKTDGMCLMFFYEVFGERKATVRVSTMKVKEE